MKISHESPLQLLEISRMYNDFDYALVHLFDQYPEYYKFFERSLGMGRTVFLDNSIFELGTAFDTDEFYKWVTKLNPTHYIVPDVFDDMDSTLRNLKDWRCKYGKNIHDGKEIVVCQGKTPSDFLTCYQKLLDFEPDMIAFPVNSQSYLKGKEYSPKNMMDGRFLMIGVCMYWHRLHEYNMKHHLLGLSLPQEVGLYKNVPEIVSVDTSNPVLHGMDGIWYDEAGCLYDKSKNKMHEWMEWVITPETFDAISHNITKFRSHLN